MKLVSLLQVSLGLGLVAEIALAQPGRFDRISCVHTVDKTALLIRPLTTDPIKRTQIYEVTVSSPTIGELVYQTVPGKNVAIKLGSASFFEFAIHHSSMTEGRVNVRRQPGSRTIDFRAEQNGWNISGSLNYCDGKWSNQEIDYWLGN